jgi:predicted house-cleaning noncanonical NTP pyrophosphatase (MazG superfamily)
MNKQYIKSQLTKANNKLCELLQDKNLQQLPNYNQLLEKASKKYDYYNSLTIA